MNQYIQAKKEELVALGSQLHKEATFAREFISKDTVNDNVKVWFNQVLSTTIYGTFLIQNLIDNLDKYTDKPIEQIGLYIGKIAISSFLEIINAFELSTNNLIAMNSDAQKLLNDRINSRIELIENSWKSDTNRKSRNLKKSLINQLENKKHEMKFIRDTFFKNDIIDELDKRILDFSWDIRNSMHNNFLAIKDISFSAPGTSLNYSFCFSKGEELYHPKDLLSFYSMTEQIIFIQLKIIQYFNNKT